MILTITKPDWWLRYVDPDDREQARKNHEAIVRRYKEPNPFILR